MNIKSKLAQFAPKKVVNKAINKGEYNGDNWATVSIIIQTLCSTKMSSDGEQVEFIYKDKTIGWARENGAAWIDNKAYKTLKEDFERFLAANDQADAYYTAEVS